MKKRTPLFRLAFVLSALVAMVHMPAAALQDIDLYAGTAGSVAGPNVLFYLDNTSNWSANSNKWSYATVFATCSLLYTTSPKAATCKSYVNQIFNNGIDSSLVQGQVEVRALKLVLNATYCNATGSAKLSFNAGVMMMANASSGGSSDSSSVSTSYIRHAIKPMDATQCTGTGADLTQYLMADLTNIDSKITASDYKAASSGEYGAGLYEAFKYFGGWTNPAGAPGGSTGGTSGVAGLPTDATHFGPVRYSVVNSFEDPTAFTDAGKGTYKSPISSCGNNYMIVIGNTFPNQEYGTDQNATPPTNTLMSRLGAKPNQLYSVSNKSDIRFADEWAQFLYTTDVSSAVGKQNVGMFTIDVFNAAQDTKQSALLLQMANSGQGTTSGSGYFKVGGDVLALVNALTDILTQIASVNSVFASAALPVSVNTQGSYLNQVFMGVFRPDADAQQRWYGNLKQYQFAKNSSGSLYLADASSPVKAAVDTANTGSIQNCATSFWTTDTSAGKYWETITGSASNCATSGNSVYSDAPDGPIVERGGAAQKLRALGYGAARNIRTCSGTTSCVSPGLVDFNTTNVTAISGLSTATATTLVNWARGQNTGDGTYSTSGTSTYNQYMTANSAGAALTGASTRPTVHGEVVHSTPLAVNYGSSSTGTSGLTNDVVVFYGAGDGTLRAIDGNQTSTTTAGQELWSFIAPEHWSALDRVRTNSPLISYPNVSPTLTPTPAPKTYFFDGPITGYQDANPLTKLWIYAAMRRGGNMVYAFDVSSRPSSTSQPTVLWKFGCATSGTGCPTTPASGESVMGQSWSSPSVIRVKGIVDTATGKEEPLVVFGGGYDDCEDNEDANTACSGVAYGKGIYIMSAKKGSAQNLKYFAPTSTSDSPGRFVGDITPVDVNGDGYIDLLYAVDTRGNIWRFNTSDPANGYAAYPGGYASWPAPQIIAKVSQWGTASLAERRKFMYAPSVVVLSGTQTLVLVGTGDREKPSSTSNAAAVNNRFYGIKDTFTSTTGVVPVVGYGLDNTLADLVQVNSKTSVTLTPTLTAPKGWYMNLESSTPYEQVVTTPLTIAGVTYFNTYQAKSTSSSTTCSNLGTARGYQVDFQTGVEKANGNGALSPVTFLSSGIPTSPRGGTVVVDGTSTTFCISCASSTNNTILNPTQPVVNLRPNRTPVYRYQRIDSN